MPIWLQHLLVLTLVAGCGLFVLRQAYLTLRKGTGKLGACCSKGCGAQQNLEKSPQAVFIPIESLGKPRRV